MTVAEVEGEQPEVIPADCVTYAEASKVFGIPERRLKWAAHASRIEEYSKSEPWPGHQFNKLTFLISLSEARKYLKSIGAIE